jgi:hypothetical protein
MSEFGVGGLAPTEQTNDPDNPYVGLTVQNRQFPNLVPGTALVDPVREKLIEVFSVEDGAARPIGGAFAGEDEGFDSDHMIVEYFLGVRITDCPQINGDGEIAIVEDEPADHEVTHLSPDSFWSQVLEPNGERPFLLAERAPISRSEAIQSGETYAITGWYTPYASPDNRIRPLGSVSDEYPGVTDITSKLEKASELRRSHDLGVTVNWDAIVDSEDSSSLNIQITPSGDGLNASLTTENADVHLTSGFTDGWGTERASLDTPHGLKQYITGDDGAPGLNWAATHHEWGTPEPAAPTVQSKRDTVKVGDIDFGQDEWVEKEYEDDERFTIKVDATVLSIDGPNTFTDDGMENTVSNVYIGDETGFIKLTLWGAHAKRTRKMEVGDVYTFSGVAPTFTDGSTALESCEATLILETDETRDVTYKPDLTPANNVTTGTSETVFGKVTDCEEPQTVTTSDGEKQVRNLTIEDASGDLAVALWDDTAAVPVQQGDCLLLVDSYINTYRGEPKATGANWGMTLVVNPHRRLPVEFPDPTDKFKTSSQGRTDKNTDDDDQTWLVDVHGDNTVVEDELGLSHALSHVINHFTTHCGPVTISANLFDKISTTAWRFKQTSDTIGNPQLISKRSEVPDQSLSPFVEDNTTDTNSTDFNPEEQTYDNPADQSMHAIDADDADKLSFFTLESTISATAGSGVSVISESSLDEELSPRTQREWEALNPDENGDSRALYLFAHRETGTKIAVRPLSDDMVSHTVWGGECPTDTVEDIPDDASAEYGIFVDEPWTETEELVASLASEAMAVKTVVTHMFALAEE